MGQVAGSYAWERLPDTTMIYVTHDQVEAITLADRGDRLSLTANAADLQAFDTAGTALQRLTA